MNDTPKKSTALDAFLNLLTLITLGWFSISLGRLIFVIIEKTVGDNKDEVFYMMNQSNPLSFSIASLIIITPIFLIVSGMLHRLYKEGKLEKGAIYRWLTYLMLLVSALVIAGDLVALVTSLLDGDYKLDTILKILTVFFIAIWIFLYYWYDIKRNDYAKRSVVAKIAFAAVIVVAVTAIMAGFAVADSPKVAREKKMDAQRVADLNQISYQLEEFYLLNKKIPENMSDKRFAHFTDPETKQPYEYRKISDNSYELCATFTRESSIDRANAPYYGISPSDDVADWYYHETGRQCYEQKLDKEPAGAVISRPVKPIAD